MFRRACGYLPGSYRIATAPEPNSSRPTRFKREKAEEEFTLWQRYMRDLASAENIVVKIGGLGMLTFGFDSHRQPTPPDSSDLQRKWGRVIDTAIELFGPDRCMFESNFPVDKQSCTYVSLWNAYKKHTSSYSPAERAALVGPVFVSLPIDVMEQETSVDAIGPDKLWRSIHPDPKGLEEIASLLLKSESPAIVAGDDVARSGAEAALVALSEAIGASVWSEGL